MKNSKSHPWIPSRILKDVMSIYIIWSKRVWCFPEGYRDVGGEICWWQIKDGGNGFGHFRHQYPQSFYISFGNQHSVIDFKDTPTICKNWLKSKVSVYGEYFHTRTMWVVHLFSSVRPASKVQLKPRFEHDSCMWRHQFKHQWEYSKTFRIRPFQTGSKSINFDRCSGFFMSNHKGFGNSFSQNSIGRSGNWQKVKNVRVGPFEEFCLD